MQCQLVAPSVHQNVTKYFVLICFVFKQRQDAEPKADHNFESRQEDADVPITIKEEPVESYGEN